MDLFLNTKPQAVMLDNPGARLAWVPPLLRDVCTISVVHDEEHLLQSARERRPLDLVLLSANPEDGNACELCRQLKCSMTTSNIPVLLFGGGGSPGEELQGFQSGASEYIPLPIHPEIFKARVKVQLAHHSSVHLVRMINERLEEVVDHRSEEIEITQHATMLAMTSLAQTRDFETGNHIRRTQQYVRALGVHLKTHPRFSRFLTAHNIELLYKSAPLHDIGKVGIPDRILLKPGRFEPDEMEIMKTHTTLGRDAIEYAENLLGCTLDFFSIAKEIAYSHQEKWDGTGYPQGLAGEAIPISARLMALADVYDAVISRRVYKNGMSHEKAVEIILAGKGRHFDPDVVDAFLAIANEFRDIAERFADSDLDIAKKAEYMAMAAAT